MARQAVKIVYDDGSEQLIAPATVTPPPVIVPGPVIRGGYVDGLASGPTKTCADQFGMTHMRVWSAIHDWAKPFAANDPAFIRCRELKALGLKTLLVVTPCERTATAEAFPAAPEDTTTAKNWFAVTAAAAGGCVDAWEVYNEPNLRQYNANYGGLAAYGGLSKLTKNVFIPAYTALKAAGQFVVGASFTEACWDQLKYAIQNGYLTACDAVGYHNYGSNSTEAISRVQYVRNLIGTKPLWITEFNLHAGAIGLQGWADELVKTAQGIAPLVQAVFHFRLTKTTQAAGPAAPFNPDLSHNDPFYAATVAAMNALG